jgi:RimJ/RimL family protein N-acetyltransferase
MIQLQAFKESDFDKLISWIDSEETLIQFAGTVFKFPLDHLQLRRNMVEENRKIYKVVLNRKAIGHAELVLNQDKSVKICRLLIGDKKDRGKGYGKEIMNELIHLAFEKYTASYIELNVYAWNLSAVSLYKKLGFNETDKYSESPTVNGEIWKGVHMKLDDKASWVNI